ncbi:MAG: hypothetical protein AB1346_13485 [Thermodesulfobacteriota bacterium]
MKRETMSPGVDSCREFRSSKREEVALLVRCLLKREGLDSDIFCSTAGLAISFRGASPDFKPGNPARLLGLVMAVAHLLDEEHKVAPDFVIQVDFWGKGRMSTTVGKAAGLASNMPEARMTADEFHEVFDFRLGETPVRRAASQ